MEGSADPQKNLDGKEHAELDFAPYMSFLPDVLPHRKTTSNAISDELSSDESLDSSTISYIDRGEEPSPAMAMCRMLGKFLQHQQNNPVSRPRPILGYWISELNSMRPEDAAKVEKKMTMLLWDEKEALNY
ncbi:uncharacterized protein LOC119547467 isoform X2 [Drosophila subpulchrella]|uniref:uncharacterized protein LOC119547467 isoform X2 n=1 Tax=Drosophila subpulchrella TaxID=1486046 RepID=UPI0018A1B18D|nr:uncharacterized protein LOC119547467 isoform X2 [Drosophila subpulchrella]